MFARWTRKPVMLLSSAVVMLTLATLACGESSSPAKETPISDMATPETVAEQPPPEPSATPTPGPTVDVSDCTLGAAFEADVTVPDNTRIEAGQPFVKTWRIRNTGTCEWGAGFRVTFIGGEQMTGTDSVSVPETPAGESTEVSVELIAPMEEGQHRGNWQMCVNRTECFGDRVYVQIISYPAPAPASTPLPTEETGGFVDCLACASQHPYLIYLRSGPGEGVGTVIGGLRHNNKVTIVDAEWHTGEGRWWYLVEGWDEYTDYYGHSVTGWLPEANVTVDVPEPYPFGSAWIEFAVGAQEGMAATVWDRSCYYNLQGLVIGSMWHGTRVETIDSKWDAEYGVWFYQITGPDYETNSAITGWIDGIFLVLAPPPG